MCGKGYACFFSGFNYQCCPSEEDDDSFASLECPAPALTILDGDGGPIRCNPVTRPCPQVFPTALAGYVVTRPVADSSSLLSNINKATI